MEWDVATKGSMARNFYYAADARVVAGSANFAALVGASPSSYGIPEWRAARYVALDADLQSKYRAATTPETRSPVAVAEKTVALKAVQREATNLARIAYATAGVDDARLMTLGLRPRPVRRPRAPAMEPPVVDVISVVGRIVKLRVRPPSGHGASKSPATLGANVFSFVGPQPPSDPLQYHFDGLATRRTYEIVFGDEVASGSTAWVSAGWVSRRGVRGMACAPVQLTITGGPVRAAATTLKRTA